MLYHPKGDDRLVMNKNSPRTYFLVALLVVLIIFGIYWINGSYKRSCVIGVISSQGYPIGDYSYGPCVFTDISYLLNKIGL